jgi:hypothetical protein
VITRNIEVPGSYRKTTAESGKEYEYTRRITVNTVADDERTIEGVIPQYGDVFTFRGRQQFCTGSEISRADRLVWDARISFAPLTVIPDKPKEKDPIRWPIDIKWGSRTIQAYPPVDIKGRPYINSAGDRLKDRPPVEIIHPTLTITRYEVAFNAARMLNNFAGRINSTPWYACAPGTAKLFFPDAGTEYIEAMKRYYWKVPYVFEIAPEGWDIEIGDIGKQCLVDETFMSGSGQSSKTGKKIKVSCKDEAGLPSQEDQFLDGKGGQMSFDDVRKGKLYYIKPKREGHKQADFNQLRLP